MHLDDAVPTTNNPLHYREGQDTIAAVQMITYVRNSCPLTYDDQSSTRQLSVVDLIGYRHRGWHSVLSWQRTLGVLSLDETVDCSKTQQTKRSSKHTVPET